MRNKSLVYSLILVGALSACSTTKNRLLQQNLITEIKAKNYTKALEITKNKDFFNEERSILLKKLETATTHYLAGNFYQALQHFDEAKKISDDLYTKSISKKMAGFVDSNLDNFYGERYERSLIRFYQSLVNYNLYKKGEYEAYIIIDKNDKNNVKNIDKKILTDSEKRMHLFAARSAIIEWDSVLNSYKNEVIGKAVYKADLTAKLWGAFIHEEFDSSNDRQIALQLYRDAQKILLQNYNIYPTFNLKHKEFDNNFKNLHKLAIKEVEKKYISKTQYSKDLSKFIEEKIKKLSSNQKDNVVILLKEDLIVQKKAKEISIPVITIAALNTNFATSILNFSEIKFEMPYVEQKEINSKFELVVSNLNGNEINKLPIILVNPLSDIAYKNISDKLFLEKAKIITSLTAKYLIAIQTAQVIYEKNPNMIGLGAAVASFKGAEKLIQETSKADLRQWLTLPCTVRMTSLNLDNGTYNFKVYQLDEKNSKHLVYNQNIEIKNNKFIDINL